MNNLLLEFIGNRFTNAGEALDLGAGKMEDVRALKKIGWKADGVDLTSGINLENFFNSGKKYDLVYSNFLIHKIKHRQKFIQTIDCNLKSGGWLFILTFDKTDNVSSSDLDEGFFVKYLEDRYHNIETEVIDIDDNEKGHNHDHKVLRIIAQKK